MYIWLDTCQVHGGHFFAAWFGELDLQRRPLLSIGIGEIGWTSVSARFTSGGGRL